MTDQYGTSHEPGEATGTETGTSTLAAAPNPPLTTSDMLALLAAQAREIGSLKQEIDWHVDRIKEIEAEREEIEEAMRKHFMAERDAIEEAAIEKCAQIADKYWWSREVASEIRAKEGK